MPIPNPVYGLMVPFLCVVTLPLAIFAGITTTLAFSVLMFRVLLVYIDIAVSLVPQYVMGRGGVSVHQRAISHSHSRQGGHHELSGQQSGSESAEARSGHSTPPLLPPLPPLLPLGYITTGHRSPTRTSPHAHFASPAGPLVSPVAGRRSRRSSLGGNSAATSTGTITPGKEESNSTGHADGVWMAGGTGSSAFTMLEDVSGYGGNPAVVRDFEGVGGWRLASDETGDDSDWAKINSRLELPLERTSRQSHQGSQHHHYRTPSGRSGSVTPGEGSWLMMKNSKRRGSEAALPSSDAIERDRDTNRGPAAGSSVRTSVSPNSSRVRIAQGVVAFTGVERNDGYFPPTASPKSARKGP